MAPASAEETEKQPSCPSRFPKVQCEFAACPCLMKKLAALHVPLWPRGLSEQQHFHIGPRDATVSPCLHYEILQFPLEEDDEFFGGLCGGLKDFERLRLLALLPLPLPPPEAALLATE